MPQEGGFWYNIYMKKITILGLPASGKTTLANKIGAILNIPVTHLDKIFWKEKGGIKQDSFVEELSTVMENDKWIIEGSMPRSKTLDMRIKNANTIVLIDVPLVVVFWRQIKRFFKYFGKVRPDMADGVKQIYPITWSEFKHAINYPMKDLHKKVKENSQNKKVFIIKNSNDEIKVLDFVKDLK